MPCYSKNALLGWQSDATGEGEGLAMGWGRWDEAALEPLVVQHIYHVTMDTETCSGFLASSSLNSTAAVAEQTEQTEQTPGHPLLPAPLLRSCSTRSCIALWYCLFYI
jgi:hypothetical protein